jgi:hypothetical protein
MKVSTALLLATCLTPLLGCTLSATPGRGRGDWYTGEFSEPAHAARWGYGSTDYGNVITVMADTAQPCTGQGSIVLSETAGGDTWAYFPNTNDMDFDASGCTGLRFSIRSQKAEGVDSDPVVVLKDGQGKAARFQGTRRRMKETAEGWVAFEVPLGSAAQALAAETAKKGWEDKNHPGVAPPEWLTTVDPGFDWKQVASVQLHVLQGRGLRIWYDGVEFVSSRPPRWWLSSLEKPDLTVTYAEQLPHYRRYVPGDYSNPSQLDMTSKHWSDEGEVVTYIVHVRNVGFTRSAPTDFTCSIAGKTMKTAAVPALAVREETTIEVPWKWRQGPYRFEAQVDPQGLLDQISKKNNTLTFNTDAYTLYAICETGMTKQVDAVNNSYGSFSYEDWLRADTVDTMNKLFQHSRYDFAPQGAKVTVRIGRIYVVDTATDEIRNRDELLYCDGGWTYASKGAMEYCNLANSYAWGLTHELSHQIGIIDDYMMNLEPPANKINGKGYYQPGGVGGIMTGGLLGDNTPPAYADIDVFGMNMTYGKRRGHFGEYLYCTPDNNTLILTIGGKPAALAEVQIYQKGEENSEIKGDPIFTGKTDVAGRFPLANRTAKGGGEVFSERGFTTLTGCTMKPNPFGHINITGINGLFLVRARVDDKWQYGFVDIARFAVEYGRGHKEQATYTIELKPE